MTHRLRVASVASAGQLQRSLSPGAASAHGEFDGDILVVDDAADAEALVSMYPNVEYADAADADHTSEPSIERATINAPGDVDRPGDESTADTDADTDTCTAVKTDGEVCGRERPCRYHD